MRAARRELAGDQNWPPKVWRYYMFLNKDFINPFFFLYNTPMFYTAALFVKYCYTTGNRVR